MKVTASRVCTIAAMFLVATPALAEVGVTDGCQDDADKIADDIEKNRDDYTAESIAKARSELTAARTNRLDPVKCRKNLQDARQALREGKRDKRD